MKKIIATCIIYAAAFTVATAQPPAHDEPCGAVQVSVGVSTDPCTPTAISTANCTYNNLAFPVAPCTYTFPDVWYKFIATDANAYMYTDIANGNGGNAYFVYSATACNAAFTYFTCGATLENTPVPLTNLVIGNTYYIRICINASFAVDFGLCIYSGFPASTQKVGIHTNLPATNLDVAGNVNFRHKVDIAGNVSMLQKVGIGEANPQFPLTFSSTLGDKISLFGNAPNNPAYGFGIQSNLLQIHTSAAGEDVAFGYGSSSSFTEKVRIKGNGNVGIGVSNPSRPLSFPPTLEKKISFYPGGTGDVGISVSGNDLRIYSDNANARVSFGYDDYVNGFTSRAYVLASGTTAMVVQGNLQANNVALPSDIRYKTNILPIANAASSLLRLKGVTYHMLANKYNSMGFDDKSQIGLIAQDVEKIFPQLVTTNADGLKSVNYIGLIPVLIESIKEQQKQIDQLNKMIKKLTHK